MFERVYKAPREFSLFDSPSKIWQNAWFDSGISAPAQDRIRQRPPICMLMEAVIETTFPNVADGERRSAVAAYHRPGAQ